jgi:hypothetical protein
MNRNHPSDRTRGHALVIQVVIVLVIAGVIALPIYFLARSKIQQKNRLLDEIVSLMSESNRLKSDLAAAYDRIARSTRRLPHSEQVKREYSDEFAAIFRRYHEAQKKVRAGESRPTIEELVALKRDFEDYRRRVSSHYQNIKTLLDLVDLAETSLMLARHYQTGIRQVRETASFSRNRNILPQLEEADRQLATGMSFVLSGIDKYPEDLRGKDTPVLIKAGIEQIRRVTKDVDGLFDRLAGTRESRVVNPNVGDMTLEAYLELFRRERQKIHLAPLPELAGTSSPGKSPERGQ